MLFVPTRLESINNGSIRVISNTSIPKGEIIWRFNSLTTQVFWKKRFIAELGRLPIAAIRDYLRYSYLKNGNVYFRCDNFKYIEHSFGPNVALINSNTITTIRPVKKNEAFKINFVISYDRGSSIFNELAQSTYNKEKILSYLKREFASKRRPLNGFKIN